MSILQEIRPIPTGKQRTMQGRKQNSEILTSTPIKMVQKQKRDTLKAKKKISFDGASSSIKKVLKQKQVAAAAKMKTFDVPGPSSSKGKKMTSTKRNLKTNKMQQNSYFCTVCKEAYIHPPIEDWIQCEVCREWTHENCSSYPGRGSYFCEDCFD